ncbi:MAG TPA: acyl-CoA dehydrogenase family protein [Stellaceae bacterium]|nr:acyl-CoA dehydrogenase family protein [Stellaceae bacterium]
MDFELTPEQRAIQETARDFAAREFRPHAAEWDAKEIFPVDALRAAAALGFAGIYVKDEVGGAGLSRLDAALVFEELATGCVSTAAYLSIHNMAAWMIDRFGNDEQRRRFLPRLASMEHFASYCLTEPGAGSDAASLKTRAVRHGDHYVIDGAKAFISGGGASDVYVAMVRTGGEGPKGISTIVVEKGARGLSYGKKEKKLGWNTQPTAMVIFENCRVPVANRLGEEGDGFKIAMQTLDFTRPGTAIGAVGVAQAAFELAVEYAKERVTFDVPIAMHQGVNFMIADMATEIEAARLLTWQAAWLIDRGERATLHSSFAKRFAADTAMKVTTDAVQVFGGYGYMKEYPVEKLMRDAKLFQIYEGTSQIQRLVIAKEIFLPREG